MAASPGEATIADLQVWRVARGKYACILSVTAGGEITPDELRRRLAVHEELVHVTVEINRRPARPDNTARATDAM